MSRPQPQKFRKRVILLPILAVALLAVGAAFAWHYHTSHQVVATKPKTQNQSAARPANSIDYSAGTPSDNASNESRKSSSTPSTTLNSGSSAPAANSSSSSFTATIVSANATGNNNIHIGTLVQGTNTGTCTLTVTQSGQQAITKTASVQQDVNNYDCGVFNIQVPSKGTWNITLTVSNGPNHASDSQQVRVT